MGRISILAGLTLAVSLLSVAVAQENEADKVPQFKAESAHRSADIGKWVYFVSNDPLFAVFNVDDATGEVNYYVGTQVAH